MALFGNPKRGTEVSDEQGTYLLYDRTCKLCSLTLTSRNRHQLALLCKPCAASKERDKSKDRPTRHRQSRPAWMVKQEQDRRVDPDRKKAHALLDTVLSLPTDEGHKNELDSYLMTYQIKALMKNL